MRLDDRCPARFGHRLIVSGQIGAEEWQIRASAGGFVFRWGRTHPVVYPSWREVRRHARLLRKFLHTGGESVVWSVPEMNDWMDQFPHDDQAAEDALIAQGASLIDFGIVVMAC